MINEQVIKTINERADILKEIMHRICMPYALIESHIRDIKNTNVLRYKWPIPGVDKNIVYEFDKHEIDYKVQNSTIELESGRLFVMFDQDFKLTGIEAEYKVANNYVFCVKYDEKAEYKGVSARHYRYTKEEIVEKINNIFNKLETKFKTKSSAIQEMKDSNYTIVNETSNCTEIMYQDNNGLMNPSRNIVTEAVEPPYDFMKGVTAYFTLSFDGDMNIEKMYFASNAYRKNEAVKYTLHYNKDLKIESLNCIHIKNKIKSVITIHPEGLSEQEVLFNLEIKRLIDQSVEARELLPEYTTVGVYDFNNDSFNQRIELLKMMMF
jgi:hypothetical protein